MLEESRRTFMGKHEAQSLAGPKMLKQLDALSEISPALGRLVLEAGFGDALGGVTVGYREWCLMTLAALMCMGDAAEQSQVYLEAATRNGATEHEIRDVLSLCYGYAGAPRAVTAARRIKDYLDQANEQFLPGSTEEQIQLADHTTMIWDSCGKGLAQEGVPMVLIHALDMDHRFWREVFPALANKGRTIAYDMRGHGRARGAPLTQSLEQLAGDLAHLLDRLEIPVADVYGASFGGAVVQQFALQSPARLRSMALIATGAKAPKEELSARATDAEEHGMEAQVAKSVIRWFLPESIAQDLWMVRYARNCVRRSRVEEWAASWRAMAALDMTESAKKVEIPVLVLSGTKDLSATPDAMRATAKIYKKSEFVSIDGGTHMLPMEQSEKASEALGAFRDRVEAESRAVR